MMEFINLENDDADEGAYMDAAFWEAFDTGRLCGRAEKLCQEIDRECGNKELDERQMATWGPIPF